MPSTHTRPTPDDRTALLSARDLRKTYRLGRVDVPVLRGASLDVLPGERVAILGASGSGKSTLLHLLGGLDVPDSGGDSSAPVLRFGDQLISGFSARQLDRYRNSTVGFVFQFYHLLPELSVVENVMIPARALHGWRFRGRRHQVEERAGSLLSSFGLGHRLRHRPSELSGGERQRVAIARALINDPPLLLADEPTGNLDRETGAALLDSLLSEEAGRRTMVLVTHDAEVARRADRVVRLRDGRFVEE